MAKPTVHLLDYVAGNIRSLVNAIEKCGYEVEMIKSPEDVKSADVSHACPQSKPAPRLAMWRLEQVPMIFSGVLRTWKLPS